MRYDTAGDLARWGQQHDVPFIGPCSILTESGPVAGVAWLPYDVAWREEPFGCLVTASQSQARNWVGLPIYGVADA